MISVIKSYFRADSLLSKIFLGAFVFNGAIAYYYGFAWDCSHRICGGVSGVKFWFAINLWLFLNHFCFWVRDESEEFSRFFPFRAFCVMLFFFGHLVFSLALLSLMQNPSGVGHTLR